ncbi:hypothetical protein PVAND_000663 [Polypedilum vanderplanki]|uniref:BTB domain-containing protein n=1 Tax=Polypedilum vanderplanki TaxID=319348 RepID=A0A9J6BLP8_POLVA|nr:hypothetical protein PVAND_000663 [Polypedilum vanderplanki]
MTDKIIDWQVSRHSISSRGTYLLETGKYSDCSFIVGDSTLACHKIILAMASPVFEAMFFGSFDDQAKNAIVITDVQAEAFKSLLEYIYTDKININNVDKAFELCYAAKKYMLPFVVDQCTQYLWSDLSAKNACRAYEFARLFEEPSLQEKCLQIICTKTTDVIQDSSFEEVELSTIITILDQDDLNVDSELSLFFALNRYAEKHGLRHDMNDNNGSSTDEEMRTENLNEDDAGPSNRVDPPQQQQQQPNPQRVQESTIRDAVKKIRFLTLSPQQFAEGPARTSLLTQSEAFAILMNISTPNSQIPMPEGFTLNKNSRVPFDSRSPSPPVQVPVRPSAPSQISVSLPQHAPLPVSAQLNRRSQSPPPHHLHSPDVAIAYQPPAESPSFNYFQPIYAREPHFPEDRRNHYCIRTTQQIREIQNRSVIESSFTFTVDRAISILGLQMFTQIKPASFTDRYSEIIYAHLLDSLGSRLTYTHSNQRVPYDTVNEIFFDRPVFIQSNKIYKIGVVFNKPGLYQEYEALSTVRCSNTIFTFNTGNSNDTVREGLIRGLIYNL